MSFLSKRTPLYKTKREESPTRALHSSLNWENFKCELHPQLQIQALHHNKRNNTFSLVCVKCIIEGDYFTDGEDESITVKDLLDTVEEKIRARRNTMYDSPENMQEKFVNFLLKDYIGTYEKYLESQASQIDNAIEETIEKLTKVREKYRQYYSKQLAYVRDQGTDIKDEINKQLENEGGQTSSNFTSMNEIYKKIEKIENSEDLLDFFSELYKKTKEQGSDTKVTDSSYSSSRLLERMESFKDKAVSARSKDVDITRFENMQEALQNLLKTDSQAFKNSVERPERAERSERSERMERSEKVERGERTERTERSSKGMKMEYETPRSRLFESSPIKSRLLDSRSHSDVYNPSPVRSVSSESEEESYVKAPKRRQPDPVRRPRKANGTGGSHDIASHSLRNLKKELEKYEDQEDPLSPDSKKEKIMTSLSDWINRRITGYLVFQNTMNSDPDAEKEGGISETGVHLNQAMGKRWKSLSEEEREEFKALAKEFRKEFKQDLEENEDFEDTDALIEGLDERIKKLKRE